MKAPDARDIRSTRSPRPTRTGRAPSTSVSLEVHDGEFMVLVGPSGCGKSTLLKLIAGIEETTDGRIRIGERDVTELDPRKRDIAMVFQNYALYPHLSVRGQPGLRPEAAQDVASATSRRRVDEVAKILGLEEMLERKPGELSGGQRQRVAMGRAIVREPQAFLMDEPSEQPRRQAARLDAGAALAPARAAGRDDRLRHPRPGRGDDARPARRGPARRRAAAVRHARDAVRPSREPVRRGLHRLAGDEPGRGGRRGRRGALRLLPRAAAPRAPALRGRIVLGIRPHDLKLGTAPALPAACRSSSGSGPRPTSSSASTRRACAPRALTDAIDAAPDDDVLLAEDDRASFTLVTEAARRGRRRRHGRARRSTPPACTASTSRPARRSAPSRCPPTHRSPPDSRADQPSVRTRSRRASDFCTITLRPIRTSTAISSIVASTFTSAGTPWRVAPKMNSGNVCVWPALNDVIT